MFGMLSRAIFGFDLKRVRYERLGFHSGEPDTKEHLQRVVDAFIHAFNVSLLHGRDPKRITYLLDMLEPNLRGFAHEGAAMGLALTDMFRLKRHSRFLPFAHETAPQHGYMAYIGAGMALAATHRRPNRYWADLDPFTRWLVWDGFGFHHAFFKTQRALRQHQVPPFITGLALREFDAGMGRAIWFVECGNSMRIQETIERFPDSRRPDLWAGVGLATVYACGVEVAVIQDVFHRSGAHADAFAQGAVLACHARHRAENPVPAIDKAAKIIWGVDSITLHELAEESIEATRTGETEEEPQWFRFTGSLRESYSERSKQEVA